MIGWLGSASKTLTVAPRWARYVAMSRVDVLLPAPPFGFETAITGKLLTSPKMSHRSDIATISLTNIRPFRFREACTKFANGSQPSCRQPLTGQLQMLRFTEVYVACDIVAASLRFVISLACLFATSDIACRPLIAFCTELETSSRFSGRAHN